jgi:hypothetical protein
MSITSGGMGKKELSANETTASAHEALGWAASSIIQSYTRLSMAHEYWRAPSLSIGDIDLVRAGFVCIGCVGSRTFPLLQ